MKFKCKVSGTVVEFVHQHDIEDMYRHPGYEPVVEEVKPVEEPKEEVEVKVKPTKKGK